METQTAQRVRNQVATPAPDELRITRVFNAPRTMIWRAWTTPAMLVHWFGCAVFTTTHAEADVRIGGRWQVTMRAPDGLDYLTYGTYLDVLELERLIFTHHWDRPVVEVNPPFHETRVTVTLHDEGGRTRLEFRQTGLVTEASRDSHAGGWCDSMDALAAWLAGSRNS
jgi:uncharacterized protein YndB with AHSA1/START domain